MGNLKNPNLIILKIPFRIVRKGIYFLLNREENIEILFEASNGKELIDKLKESTQENLPDIIMMDLKMPEMEKRKIDGEGKSDYDGLFS